MTSNVYPPALSAAQIEQFIEDGFIRIDEAFPRELAQEARAIMWCDIPFGADDPRTWTQPVVRLAGYGGGPFYGTGYYGGGGLGLIIVILLILVLMGRI